MNELPPLSDLARALVAEEQHTLAARAALRARVQDRLESAMPGLLDATIGLGHLAGGGAPPDAAQAAGTTGTVGAAGTGTAAAGAAGTASAIAKPVTLAAGKLAALLATTFAIGAGTGAAVDRATTRGGDGAAPRDVPSAAATARPRPSPPAPPPSLAPDAPAPPPSVAPPATSAAPAAPTTSSDRKGDLARERALIDAARSGLAHDNPSAALDAVRRHAEAFPRGQLSEERDAIRVLALASSGRREEATRAAATFRARYPQSLFSAQITAALGNAP